MYNRLYSFLEKKQEMFLLQGGFDRNVLSLMIWFILHVKLHKTDKGNYACGIFVYFESPYTTETAGILVSQEFKINALFRILLTRSILFRLMVMH